jgi:biotin operon repressor
VHHPDGGWAVKDQHAERISSRHATQGEAQARAKEILSHAGGGEAVTHGRDGRFSGSDTVAPAVVDWSLLSPQGHVLFYIALCPSCTTEDIARALGRTKRHIWNLLQSLKDGGMLQIRRKQRRHHFTINLEAPMLHPTIEGMSLRSLMADTIEQAHKADPTICD